VEEYLLEYGYVAPVDVGLTRGAYTVTLVAGLKWLDRGLSEAPAATRTASTEGAEKRGTPTSCATPGGGMEASEGVGSIVLRGERDRLLHEPEQQRPRAERLETELERRRSSWWRRWFGG
jgi:hypothetical protein